MEAIVLIMVDVFIKSIEFQKWFFTKEKNSNKRSIINILKGKAIHLK